MNSKEDNKIKIEQISIFDEILFFIDLNEINKIIKEISKNILLDGLIEEEEIKYEKNDMNSSNISFKSNPIKPLKFPNYDGSFKIFAKSKEDIDNKLIPIIKEKDALINELYHKLDINHDNYAKLEKELKELKELKEKKSLKNIFSIFKK